MCCSIRGLQELTITRLKATKGATPLKFLTGAKLHSKGPAPGDQYPNIQISKS